MRHTWHITVLQHHGLQHAQVRAGTRFECNFGFVGAEAEGGRICVPYEEEVDPDCPTDCGSDGQPACDSAPPTLL